MRFSDAVRERIREICAQYDLTLFALCQISDVPVAPLRQFMRGYYHDIRLSTIYRICGGIGISVHEFFNSELFDQISGL